MNSNCCDEWCRNLWTRPAEAWLDECADWCMADCLTFRAAVCSLPQWGFEQYLPGSGADLPDTWQCEKRAAEGADYFDRRMAVRLGGSLECFSQSLSVEQPDTG